jgi:hypothetical protein
VKEFHQLETRHQIAKFDAYFNQEEVLPPPGKNSKSRESSGWPISRARRKGLKQLLQMGE